MNENLEIERKFLVESNEWKSEVTGSIEIEQGYIDLPEGNKLRIRVTKNSLGKEGYITMKTNIKDLKFTRVEYESLIDESVATAILSKCLKTIKKTRHFVDHEGFEFSIDDFHGSGLLLAEIELNSEGQEFPIPKWLGEEVSYSEEYFNCNM